MFPIGSKIQCVDASDTGQLVEGEIYFVIDCNKEFVRVATPNHPAPWGGGFYVRRFMPYKENPAPTGFLSFPYNMALFNVQTELLKATAAWPAFNSAHEAYAVMLEEVDELWDEVKVNQKKRDLEKMRKEAIQVAAMAIRFAAEVCNEQAGRK